MNQITSEKPFISSSMKETLLFIQNDNQSLMDLKNIINISKVNSTVSVEENKKSKFLIKKRGRKNKDKETKSDEDVKEKTIHSKYSNDNIKRRIKGLFNNYIIYLLNDLIKKKYKRSKIKFVKMNIKITKDIGIEFNRSLLEKPIKEIIINVSNKYQDQNNNKNCIKFIQEQKDNEDIIKILNLSYKELYTDYYLKSTDSENSFEFHKEKILEICGKEYLDKFIKNSEGFIDFFTNGKNRKARKVKEIEVNINLENEGNETISTDNEVNNDNIENYFLEKNMASCSTQTDIAGINLKILTFG